MTLVETIKSNAGYARAIGIVLVIAGFLALLSPLAAGLSITLVIGVLLLFGGASQLLLVFRAGSFGEGLMMALLGVLWIVAGGYTLSQPVTALAALTLFLAAYFLASGIVEIIGAFRARPDEGWGWILFSGIISALLGLMIWRQFPLSGVWAVGILIGIRIFMTGSALIAVGSAAKRAAASAEPQAESGGTTES